MTPLSFLQRILTKVRGNGFRWGESVGTGEQLPPKQVCWKSPDFKTNTGI